MCTDERRIVMLSDRRESLWDETKHLVFEILHGARSRPGGIQNDSIAVICENLRNLWLKK